MIKFDFVTIGSATKDLMYYAEGGAITSKLKKDKKCKHLAFELGSKFEISEAYFNYGGGANNVAVALSRLGFKTASVMSIGGGDFGRDLVKNLKKEKVGTSLVQINKNETTGLSIIINSKKDQRYLLFVSRGANTKITFSANKNRKLDTKWFYINSLNFTGWEKIINEITAFKQDHPTTLLHWNPGKYQIQAKKGLLKLLKLTEVLQINKAESLELITNHSHKKIKNNNIKTIIETIYNLGPKIVVITDGKSGAYCFDGKKLYKQKSLKPLCKDTTGAGDSFGSAFVAGLELFNGNIEKALQMGVVNSGSVVTEYGAQNGLLNKQNILKIIKK